MTIDVEKNRQIGNPSNGRSPDAELTPRKTARQLMRTARGLTGGRVIYDGGMPNVGLADPITHQLDDIATVWAGEVLESTYQRLGVTPTDIHRVVDDVLKRRPAQALLTAAALSKGRLKGT